ncbi:hypothetical protein KKC13_11180 [bacterium]|nr:hypothetical protein [bacterium]MBU1957731.1 hypothetical protein [bacterium]
MKKTVLIAITLVALLLTTGCSPMTAKYRVTVDAITAPNVSVAPTTYTLKALGTNTDANSLTFQQQSGHLTQMLNTKGYTMATHPSIAQQVIYFDYGIEKIKETSRTYSQPDVTFGFSWGYPYGYYGRHYHPFYHDFWYGGHTMYRQTYTYHNRYITLLAKEQTGKELWRVDVSSIGESKNLKKIVPMLLEAAEKYIGTNTAEPVKLIMKENINKKE